MGCCRNSKENITLNVEGMSCNHCKMAVENVLKDLGVEKIEVDLNEKKVSAIFDAKKTSVDTIKKAITEAGYDVVQ